MLDFFPALDVKKRLDELVDSLGFGHVRKDRVVCFRSRGSKTCATARIWGLSRVWQLALGVDAHYVVELVSERFDRLSKSDRDRVLIHELLHVPKTFSGALVPHRCFGKRLVGKRRVDRLFDRLCDIEKR